jgi:TatD DNase family protein
MHFIDTHCHLYADEFNEDRKIAVEKAVQNGIQHLFLPNIDTASIQPMLDLVWEYPMHCFPMMGLHPCSVDVHVDAQLFQIQKWLKKRKFYAVGEIGLDYYWSTAFKDQQIMAFKKQLMWAIQLDLPVVIHSRNSNEDVIAILQELKHSKLRGIFHCFGGTLEQAQQLIELNFYIGIGGVVTYKNSGLDKVVAAIPTSKIVLETDAPYLAPVPFRGKRNEPFYLIEIAKKVAEIKGIGLNQLANTTTANAKLVFGID